MVNESGVFSTFIIVISDQFSFFPTTLPPLLRRHVSAADKLGRGYRNMASVFTIDDDEGS